MFTLSGCSCSTLANLLSDHTELTIMNAQVDESMAGDVIRDGSGSTLYSLLLCL